MSQTTPTHETVGHNGAFGDIDSAAPNARISSMRAPLYVFEDNKAMIKISLKAGAPTQDTFPEPTEFILIG